MLLGAALWGGCNAFWGIDDLSFGAGAAAGGQTSAGGAGAQGGGTAGSAAGGKGLGGSGGAGPTLPEIVWFDSWGTSGTQAIEALVVQSDGNLVLAGYSDGAVDFGGGELTQGGGDDAIVVAVAGSGEHLWSRRWGDAAEQRALAAMTLAGTSPVVVGSFAGTMSIDDTIVSAAAGRDGFVTRVDGPATYFVETWPGPAGDVVPLAADYTLNHANVAGYFAGSIELDGGYVVSAGRTDVFVARVHQTEGQPVWSTAFGGEEDDRATGIAGRADNSVYVVGSYGSTVVVGADTLECAGGADVFVARVASTGAIDWARGFGDAGASQEATAVATFDGEDMVVVGSFDGSLDLDGEVLTSVGGLDIFAARIAGSGDVVWARSVGGLQNDEANAVAVAPDGTVWVAATTSSAIEFGGSSYPAAGGTDALALSFDAMGNPGRAIRAGDGSDQEATAIGVVDGDVIVAGQFAGSLVIGGSISMTAVGQRDAFLVRLRF